MRLIDCHYFLFDPTPIVAFIAQFAAIVFGMGWYPFCCCESTETCAGCADGKGPESLLVEIGGATGLACEGGNCTDMNGAYVVDYSATTGEEGSEVCYYYLDGMGHACTAVGVSSINQCEAGGGPFQLPCGAICVALQETGQIAVNIAFGGAFGSSDCDDLSFGKDFGSAGAIPCMTLDGEDIPLVSYPAVACGGDFGMPWFCKVSRN